MNGPRACIPRIDRKKVIFKANLLDDSRVVGRRPLERRLFFLYYLLLYALSYAREYLH